MAKDKAAFQLYADQKSLFDNLPDDYAGKLIKHIFSYVNDDNPTTDDLVLKIAFEPIKLQLKRDLKKYEAKCLKNKQIAEERWSKKVPKDANAYERIPNSTKSTDKDKDKDKDIYNNINIIKWDSLLTYFNQVTSKKCRVIPQKAKVQFKARLKEGYTKEDIKNAILSCYNDSYHKETNHKYLTLEFISRADKMDKYATVSNKELTKGEKLLGRM
jgi:uncharacterized phage protein (TIGR02220 family)